MIKETQEFLNYFLSESLLVDGIAGNKTKSAIEEAIRRLQGVFKKKGYDWDNHINLIGIRTSSKFTNKATDWFVVVVSGTIIAVPCSTKAGNYYVKNPITYGGITGTAVLVPNQYKNTWQFITSSNWSSLWLQTPYFMQQRTVDIIRDGNLNDEVDSTITQSGLFGINIHTSGWDYFIHNWSAGCVVIPRGFWVQLLDIFENGKFYTFTLLQNY